MALKQIAMLFSLTIILSGCSSLSLLGFGKKIEPIAPVTVEVKTVEVPIEIAQPTLPRALDLKEPQWYVVSKAIFVEPCLLNEETGERDCKLGREDKYPEGFTYLDKFLQDIEKEAGDVVFFAMSPGDYELMSYNMQEIKRYVLEMNEVILYYRKVTMKKQNEDQVQDPN